MLRLAGNGMSELSNNFQTTSPSLSLVEQAKQVWHCPRLAHYHCMHYIVPTTETEMNLRESSCHYHNRQHHLNLTEVKLPAVAPLLEVAHAPEHPHGVSVDHGGVVVLGRDLVTLGLEFETIFREV